MNTDLYSQFLKMDLTPGCSIQEVNERYKILAFLMHPDQMTGDRRREVAEGEMKTINNRRDLIMLHLKSNVHRPQGDCECRYPETLWRSKQAEQARTRQTQQSGSETQPSNPGQAAQSRQSQQPQQQKYAAPEQQRPDTHSRPDPRYNHNDRPHQAGVNHKENKNPGDEHIRPTNFSSKSTRERLKKAGIWPNSETSNSGTTPGGNNFKRTEQCANTAETSDLSGRSNLKNIFNFMLGLLFFGSTIVVAAGGAAIAKNQHTAIYSPQVLTRLSTPPPAQRTFTSCSMEKLPPAHACKEISTIPESYVIKTADLNEITSFQLFARTTALNEEFKQLLSQLQSPEAFSQNELAGRIPMLYKRFNFVDNQKIIFENELRRRGINWKES